MTNTFLLRSGTKTQFSSYSPQDGELIYVSDESQLYVGSSSAAELRNNSNPLTIYAAPNGVSTNSGMTANDPLPLVDAFSFAKRQNSTYVSSYGVRVLLQTGSYYLTSSLQQNSLTPIQVAGDYGTPRNCKIYLSGSTNGFHAFQSIDGSYLNVYGLQIIPMTTVSSSANQYLGFYVRNKSVLEVSNIVYGESGKWLRYGVFVLGSSNFIVFGTASVDCGVYNTMYSINAGSTLNVNGARTEFSNTPQIPSWYLAANNSNIVHYSPISVAGANSVSSKGSVSQFSTINLNGTPASSIPGATTFSTTNLTTTAR